MSAVCQKRARSPKRAIKKQQEDWHCAGGSASQVWRTSVLAIKSLWQSLAALLTCVSIEAIYVCNMVSRKIWRVQSERNFRQSLLLQPRNTNCYPGGCRPPVTKVSAHGGRKCLLHTVWHPGRPAHRQNQGRLLHRYLVKSIPTPFFVLIGTLVLVSYLIPVCHELPGLFIVNALICARDHCGRQPLNRNLRLNAIFDLTNDDHVQSCHSPSITRPVFSTWRRDRPAN